MGVDTGLSVEDNNTIGKVGGHDEIVLDNESSLLGVHDESLDDSRSNDTLLGIKVGRGLVNQVDIGRDTESKDNGNTLQFTTGQVLDFLVDEVLELERLDNIGLELRRQEGLLDLLEEQLANSALELGSDGLGLHADSHLRNVALAIGLEGSGQESTECGLSGTVLSHHDDNLGIGKVTGIDAKLEVAECLLHLGVGESTRLIDGKFLGGFRNTEGQGLITESQVLGGDVTVEEDVDTLTDGVRQSHNTIDGGSTVENTDIVGKIVENRQIVLDDDNVVVVTEERTNDHGSAQTLLDIEEVNVSVHDVVKFENVGDLLGVSKGSSAFDKEPDALVGSLDGPGDLVHVLRLDHSLKVIFQKLGEVVYFHLRTTEVLDDILPVRRVIVSTQVGLKLSTQDLEGGTLSDTVGSNETQNLTRSRHGKSVQLETVGAISVGDLALEVGGQVDDGNGVEGALLGADTTTDTERLGDECQLRVALDLDTELSTAHDGARLFALLTTFSRATLKGGVRKCLAGHVVMLMQMRMLSLGDGPCRC
ncbi:hypothetical protein HG530_003249 [Fusarium avenaceum]|nr:hypothetical protein HG530_003249 [Fusarium avenaceum]